MVHWLPIPRHIEFKLASSLTFKAMHTETSHYLSHLLIPYRPYVFLGHLPPLTFYTFLPTPAKT